MICKKGLFDVRSEPLKFVPCRACQSMGYSLHRLKSIERVGLLLLYSFCLEVCVHESLNNI